MTASTAKEWVEKLKARDLRALSRLISDAENQLPHVYEVLKEFHGTTNHSKVIGVTGPPGAGKSSLTGKFVQFARAEKKTIAIVAVDPVSPFTGGSLLGDRIRLVEHFNDPGVYIRSLSTRGKLGGLSLSTRQVVHLLEAFGFDYIVIETVGVGQSEIDIRKLADVTLLTLVPESGDGIQTLKAGILEIADLLVVNKSDREGADRLVQDLKNVAQMSGKDESHIFSTSTLNEPSVRTLFDGVNKFLSAQSGLIASRRKNHSLETVEEIISSLVLKETGAWVKKQSVQEKNPYQFALEFVKKHPEGTLLK